MRHTLIEVCALEPRVKQRKVKQCTQAPGMRNTSGGERPEVSSEIRTRGPAGSTGGVIQALMGCHKMDGHVDHINKSAACFYLELLSHACSEAIPQDTGKKSLRSKHYECHCS